MIGKLIEEVLRGEIDPGLAAERAIRFERLEQAVSGIDLNLVEMARQGEVDRETLIRLARFNHELSLRLGVDPLLAKTAFTLSQLLPGGAATIEERARLVELAVPILEREPRPRSLSGRIYQYAALTLFQAAGFLNTPERKQRTIDYGLRAIEFLEGLPDTALEDLWHLHHLVGSKINELETATEGDLARSVVQLEQALGFAQRLGSGERIGSTLNNLGNSLRLLGALTSDEAILGRAIQVLEDALPYRTRREELALTHGNLRAARQTLEALAAGAPVSQDFKEPSGGTADAQIAAGENYLKAVARGQNAAKVEETELQARGVEVLCEALSKLPLGDNEILRARGEMGLGIALNHGRTSTEAALGVCFLQAARRRFERLGERQHIAAAHYNIGQAFSTILDWGNHQSYLETAAGHFEEAQRGYEELGGADQALHSLLMRAGCYQQMAKDGDARALGRSRELFRNAGISEAEIEEMEAHGDGGHRYDSDKPPSGEPAGAEAWRGNPSDIGASYPARATPGIAQRFRKFLRRIRISDSPS